MMRKLVEKRVGVRGPDYSSGVWDFVEVNTLKYFSESLRNQHFKELVVTTTKPFIRLSDFRFLSSLFLRDLHHSIMSGGSVILEMFMLLAIPILMHSLSDKNSLKINFVLAKIIHGGGGVRKKHTENSDAYDCLLLLERFFSVKRIGERGVPAPYYLGSNKKILISGDYSKEEMSIRQDDVITPLLSGRWKARIRKKDLFGEEKLKDEAEDIQVVGGNRPLKDLLMFFKSYKKFLVSKSGNDCPQNNLESLPLWEIRNSQDAGQAIRFGNDSLSLVVLDPFKRALLGSANSTNLLRDESAFSYEQEAFSTMSLFMSHEKTTLFCNSISELDYEKDKKLFPVLYAYPQITNPLKNRLTYFLLIIGKSNLFLGGEKKIDVSNSIKSDKGISSSEMRTNTPFTKRSGKKLRVASNGYFDFDDILPNCLKASLKIPKKTTNRNEITNFVTKLEGGRNLDSRYSAVRLYEQNRLIPIYFTYIYLFHDYFCTLSNEYFSRLNYWLDRWTDGGEYTSLTRIAIEQTVLKWKDDVECLSNEYITLQFGECKNVQSNIHKWLNATINLFLLPVGKFLEKAIKYTLEEFICRASIVGDGLLSTTGVSLRSINRHPKRDLHRFLNVLVLSRMIVAEATRHKVMKDAFAYFIEKVYDIDADRLDKINYIERDLFSGLLDSHIDEEILSFKPTLEERRSFLVGFKPLKDQQLIGLTALKPASNSSFLGLPCIEAIRAGLLNEALSIMGRGRQIRTLFLDNLGREGKSITNEGIPIKSSDQLNERNDSRSRPGKNIIPKLRRGFFLVKNCSSSYLNLLENFPVGSDNKAISPDIISLIHPQLSESLSSNLSKQTVEKVYGYLFTLIGFLSPNLHESATIVTHLDGLRNSILHLNESLASLSSSPGKATDSFLSSCSNDGVFLREVPVNADSWSDHQRTQPRQNLVLDRVNSEEFVKDGLDSGNGSIENRVDQNGLSIKYFWELKELDTPFWSPRFSLYNDVTSISLARLFGEEVLRKDLGFADFSAREKATHPFHLINLNELSNDLNRFKISWIFWKDSIAENWGLLKEYIPLFFTPTWWKYFWALIGETYPEIILKITYDSNHDLSKIFGGIGGDLVSGAKGYLLQSLQKLGLRFGSRSIHTLSSETDLLILKKIHNEAEMFHPGKWSVSQSSNRLISYYSILSILVVLASLKQALSAVSGSNSFHSWKRLDTIEYLKDPMRKSYLRKVMYSPSTRQMLTRDLLIHSLNRFLNYVNNLIFFFLVRNELDSWIFGRESADILESKKELLTQHLVTNQTLYRYVSRLKSNSDLFSNNIFHEPYLQERSNVLAYSLQFRQNALLGHKICKLDPAEKWTFYALGRTILSSATTRRKDNLLNMPCRDIPISLQSGLLRPQGILLVGPVETGRSSIIRDVAFNSYLPVMKIPLKKFLYNRSFFRFRFKSIRGNFISKESVHRLKIVFEIAREMSPCTPWIKDIHELNISRSYHRLEADPKYLLCQLFDSIDNNLGNFGIRANVVIAMTHAPARIDPASIAPNRLSQLINLRKFNGGGQRQKELSILLRIRDFAVGANPSLLKSTVSGLAGYSKRDLFFLANEALLIATSKRKKFVCGNAFRLALQKQQLIIHNRGNRMESNSEWEISSYKMAEEASRNSLIDLYLTFIGRNVSKMRFYYLSNWYVEPLRNESTFDEFTIFSHLLKVLVKLVAHDSFQMDMGKREDFIVLNKLLANELNITCGVLENLPTKLSGLRIGKAVSPRSNSFLPPFPLGKPKYCSGVTSPSRSSKSLRRGRLSSLIDFEMQQSPELRNSRNSTTEISREITWSHKAWRLRFLRSGTYQLMAILSQPNHFYNLILVYYNQNHIPQKDSEINKIKGEKRTWRQTETNRRLFRLHRSFIDHTDDSPERLENRLDNWLLREQFLELGLSGNSSNEYKTHCDRFYGTTQLFGGRLIWDPMLLFQPDPKIPASSRDLFVTREMTQRLHPIYGLRRMRLQKLSNNKLRDFFHYCEDNPRMKSDPSINPRKNLPLPKKKKKKRRDPVSIMETYSIDIQLQYPQLFFPIRLGFCAVGEDFPERFLRVRLLVHRKKWVTRNPYPSWDFLKYNMLLETYEYLFNSFRFGKSSLDRTMKQFIPESSMS
uniref:Conserved hypothetical chloroplast protein Ycf2 n=1 Tax=Vaginularia trichoidea TaxID=474354 RepID=A0A3G5CTB8_9MONI|nr:conserved hypothetical chloroplast protein Ycf2 [Vaginularia trichoidea]YP_009547618.1 conserved hypothetical chloroplast protein Ycf2 [Vaginularia trichoidea]AYW16119.1 conserved hypothetical chloroplast protein Ycf2 [Vaginularia trichoidea]AYW16135.1 conserved hypothetical chloroplast protein Ycf2 [Vaginularia trichoidea]